MMASSRTLSAKEAAELLGVSLPTVYAYVSRGLIHSQPAGDKSRTRRYLEDDVRRLIEHKDYRRDPAIAANHAMHWGLPVLESALTRIADDTLYYRGFDATQLARDHTAEEVAALLWTGDMTKTDTLFAGPARVEYHLDELRRLDADHFPLQRLQIALAMASAHDLAAYDLDTRFMGNIVQTGARIVKLMATVLAGVEEVAAPLGQILQRGWCPNVPQAACLLDAALILCADHELNASTFAARVVASAQAHLYLVVTAGLAAIQGFRHGGSAMLIERLFHEVDAPDRAQEAITGRLRRGECIPGFGHRLYPNGDPRGAMLLALANDTFPGTTAVRRANAIAQAVQEVAGKRATVEFGLVALTQALSLPDGSALSLYALGRSIGWIGHAVEQYQSGEIIRPRATYIGPG
jgi:citrate synthase